MAFDPEATREEIRHWFFDVYFDHWMDVGAGRRDEGPEFILEYWGAPMFLTSNMPDTAVWLDADGIVNFLDTRQQQLKAAGYDHTEVPEQRIHVYNANGGAVEVIWSRQAADNSELQRLAINFQVVRFDGVWKVAGMHVRQTDAAKDQGSIDRAFAQ